MANLKCPGYRGKWFWFWGDCKYVVRYGSGLMSADGTIEYLCQHPALEIVNKPPYVGICPTDGKRP